MINEQQAIDYLSRLLNRQVTGQDTVALTSGQRARFLSWADQFGGLSGELRSVVSGGFSVRQLVSSTIPTTAPVAAEAAASAAHSSVTPPGSNRPLQGFAGVGIDIQRIAEIVPYDDAFDFRSAPDLAKIFSEREISYACARSSPAQTLAGLFAAKEALIKSDPQLASRDLWQIEILPDAAGAPARDGFQLSISHSGEYAVAMAIKLEAASRSAEPVAPAPGATRKLEQPIEVSALPSNAARSAKLAWVTLLVLIAVVAGVLWARHL